MTRPPDHSCMEEGTHGWALYSWDCVDGAHVAIGQYSSEMSCQAAVKETSACGTQTPLEASIAKAGWCKETPDTPRWPR